MEQRDIDKDSLFIQLRTMIIEHDKLQNFADVLDDEFLKGFLICKKLNLCKTVECLESFAHMRTVKYKHMTTNFRPSTIVMLDKGLFHKLKHPDAQGRVVVVMQIKKWHPSQASAQDCIATALYFLDAGIRYFHGNRELVLVLDCAGFNLDQARHATPSVIIQILDMILKCLPARLKGVHIVNEGLMINGLYRFVKPLLKSKIRERFHMHSSNFKGLHKYVPNAILPNSLGGQLNAEEAFDTEFIERIREGDAFYDAWSKKILEHPAK